ncbi:MAG: 30S ribosomal protein S6 [Bacteroidales bacterium]|nr:30S ribosomal protein S6 [Bacteroidales bacterium]
MTRRYETVFIMTPVLSEDQAKETVNKFKRFLEDRNARIIYEEDWGLRKLAYPIKKKTTGFYHLIEFESDPGIIGELELNYKRDERILRYLTVHLDKYGIEYAEKRRKLKSEQKSTSNTTNSSTI